MMLGPALLALALAGGPQAAPPARPAAEDDAALSRIRAALSRPVLRITPPEPEPTFRVEIHEHPYYTEKPWTWDFNGGGVATAAPVSSPVGSTPLVSVDILPLIRSAIRAHEQHAAEDEVRRALAEFCATHTCSTR